VHKPSFLKKVNNYKQAEHSFIAQKNSGLKSFFKLFKNKNVFIPAFVKK